MAQVIPSKVESNIKERIDVSWSLVKEEIETVKTFVNDLMSLKPVKAFVDLTVDTMDNIGDFIKRQAEITRRWIG